MFVTFLVKNYVLRRTDTPLRPHIMFLYEPSRQDLVLLEGRGQPWGNEHIN